MPWEMPIYMAHCTVIKDVQGQNKARQKKQKQKKIQSYQKFEEGIPTWASDWRVETQNKSRVNWAPCNGSTPLICMYRYTKHVRAVEASRLGNSGRSGSERLHWTSPLTWYVCYRFSLTNINRIFFFYFGYPTAVQIQHQMVNCCGWLTANVMLFQKKKKKEKSCAEVLRICLRYARWCRLDEGFWGEEISWGKLGVRMCRCRVGGRGAYAVRSKTIHLGTYPI